MAFFTFQVCAKRSDTCTHTINMHAQRYNTTAVDVLPAARTHRWRRWPATPKPDAVKQLWKDLTPSTKVATTHHHQGLQYPRHTFLISFFCLAGDIANAGANDRLVPAKAEREQTFWRNHVPSPPPPIGLFPHLTCLILFPVFKSTRLLVWYSQVRLFPLFY